MWCSERGPWTCLRVSTSFRTSQTKGQGGKGGVWLSGGADRSKGWQSSIKIPEWPPKAEASHKHMCRSGDPPSDCSGHLLRDTRLVRKARTKHSQDVYSTTLRGRYCYPHCVDRETEVQCNLPKLPG